MNHERVGANVETVHGGSWEVWDGSSHRAEVTAIANEWEKEFREMQVKIRSSFLRPIMRLKQTLRPHDTGFVTPGEHERFLLLVKDHDIHGLALINTKEGYEVGGLYIRPKARGTMIKTLRQFLTVLQKDMRRLHRTSVTFMAPAHDRRLNNFYTRMGARQFGSDSGYNDYTVTLSELDTHLDHKSPDGS